MRRFVLLVTAAVVLTPAVVRAQRLTDVASGRLIRVETTTHDVFYGPMQSVTTDTVRIGAGRKQPPVALAMQNVVGYSLGMGPDRRRGALTGMGIGGGVGFVVYHLFRNLGTQSSKAGQRTFGYSAAAFTTLLGGVLGASRPPQRWSAQTAP